MSEFDEAVGKNKVLRKITPQRLKNIGLYYLKRFESSVDNLRRVLRRRVDDYAYRNPDFNKNEAYVWIEDILNEFERLRYLDDDRYARLKIEDYINSGKPERYIKIKLRQKGIRDDIIEQIISETEYDPQAMAVRFARKKKIGIFRKNNEDRKLNYKKDLATLIRAGFDYDVSRDVLGSEYFAEDSDF